MPIAAKDQNIFVVSEPMSTKAAADALAAETRAFGNKYSKLNLQLATDAFVRAKEALLQKSAAAENTKPTDQ